MPATNRQIEQRDKFKPSSSYQKSRDYTDKLVLPSWIHSRGGIIAFSISSLFGLPPSIGGSVLALLEAERHTGVGKKGKKWLEAHLLIETLQVTMCVNVASN